MNVNDSLARHLSECNAELHPNTGNVTPCHSTCHKHGRDRVQDENHRAFNAVSQDDYDSIMEIDDHTRKRPRYSCGGLISPGIVSIDTTVGEVPMNHVETATITGYMSLQPSPPQREAGVEWWKQKKRPKSTKMKPKTDDSQCSCCFVCERPYTPTLADILPETMPTNALLAYFAPKRSLREQPLPAAAATTTTTTSAACRRVMVIRQDLCTFCERAACPDCLNSCHDCQQPFCTFCSTTDYIHGRLERTLCLECAAIYNNANDDASAMQTD
jgi:Cd27 binding protein (Siva)